MPKLSADEEAKLLAWVATRPESVQELAKRLPPWECYRMADHEDGHYTIYSYSEGGTVTVLHGSDSFLPGVRVFGVAPELLTVCGCEHWSPATATQLIQTDARIRAEIVARRGHIN